MIKSRIDAVNMVDDALVAVSGIAEALMYRSSLERDDMMSMLSGTAFAQVEKLQDVSKWLMEAEQTSNVIVRQAQKDA